MVYVKAEKDEKGEPFNGYKWSIVSEWYCAKQFRLLITSFKVIILCNLIIFHYFTDGQESKTHWATELDRQLWHLSIT